MTEYFVPKAMVVKLPSGSSLRLWRGLHALPDELTHHAMANSLGIKTQDEMTDAEWRSIGLKKPAPVPPMESAAG